MVHDIVHIVLNPHDFSHSEHRAIRMILDITGAVLVIILVWCILKYIQHIWSLSKYPNGPFPLPIIGNFHLFAGGDPTYMTFIKLREKYGDVFSVSMGKLYFVQV